MTTQELDLKKAMQFFFVDEVAHDVGGVYREWYTQLFDRIFSDTEGFFYRVDDKCLGMNSYLVTPGGNKGGQNFRENYIEYYEFIGKIIGKAIFDKITIKTNFNRILIKHLLKIKCDVEDLKFLDMGYYNSMIAIMESKMGDFSELYFTWNIKNAKGEMEEIELIKDGKNIMINDENKFLFVSKV
jgi:hypothetical protein